MDSVSTQASLSVIIPTYNYANYIGRAVESVLAQDIPCEIIVVDDGSLDNTHQIIEGFGSSVTYIHQNNQGVSAARNNGASHASGNYLIFLDADDCLLPGVLSLISAQIQKNPQVDCFLAGRISIGKDGIRKTSIPSLLSESSMDNFAALLRKKLGSVTTAAIRRTVFDTLKFPESIRNNEDIVLVAHVLARFSCKSIQQPVIEVHKHDDSLRHNIESIMESTDKVTSALFDPSILPSEFMSLEKEFSSRVILSRFRSLYLSGRKKEARKLYNRAILLYPRHIFLFGYLKKYIKSYFSV